MRFVDRGDAGRQLAAMVTDLGLDDPVVLALPRGGVPVAVEVAGALGAPLDVFVTRKVGAPHHEELAIGAVAEGGEGVVDHQALEYLGVSPVEYERLRSAQLIEVERRVRRYRGERPLPDLAGRDVVLVDDGLATGATAEAALRALRHLSPARLVLGVPVCSGAGVERVAGLVDEVVCVMTPPAFSAVGAWYENFDQTTDEEVESMLTISRRRSTPPD